jgi:hypothetical protein
VTRGEVGPGSPGDVVVLRDGPIDAHERIIEHHGHDGPSIGAKMMFASR